MKSYLYFASADRTAALTQLRRLRAIPGLESLANLRLIDCLTVESAYPAETLAPLLTALGGMITLDLPLTEDTRCIPMPVEPSPDCAMLLAAAGVDAMVTKAPLVLLRGVNDDQYRLVRDALVSPSSKTEPNIPSLPEDAFIGFTRTPVEQLCAEAHRYGLALPDGCIAAIADHYTALRRDPWPDELLILDAAYRQAITEPATCAPVEFITNDPRLHAAYADLMAKRRLLAPDAEAPAALGELASTATRYLCAHYGRPTPPARLADSAFALAASGRSACGGFADLTGETALYMASAPRPVEAISAEDRLLFVHADHPDRLTAALERFFASPAAGQVRRSLPVPAGRLIAALGRILGASGCGLRLIPPADGTPLANQLIAGPTGALLACAPGAGRIIPDALRAEGLRFALLAVVHKQPNIILDGAPERLSFPAAMLAPRPALYAEIPAPESVPLREIDPIPAMLASLASPTLRRTLGYDPLTAPLLAQPMAGSTVCGGLRLCADTIEPEDDPFAAVRDCALALIARLVAAGARLDGITLACTAHLPLIDRRDNGRAIAALLGLHAVQTELGIVAEPAVLRHGEHLRITVAAYAADTPTTPALPDNTPLWLIAPRSTEPHLDGEGTLLRLAADLRSAGQAVIATGLLTPSAAAARAVTAAGQCLTLTAPPEVLNTPLPCGMLIAAPEMPPLPEGVAAIALGYTRPWEANAVCWGESSLSMIQLQAALRGDLPAPLLTAKEAGHPPRLSMRRAARPRVLIPFADRLPDALAAVIASFGGEPVLCPVDLTTAATARQSLSAYANALDGAQILLLSGSRPLAAALLSQRRAMEALQNFRARDGLVCAWGEAFSALLSVGLFSPNGEALHTAPLSGQRILGTALTSTASPWIGDLPLGYREMTLTDADPLCPVLSPEHRAAMAAEGCILSCAVGTPDGTPAISALTTPDGAILGLASPPSPDLLRRGIAYFA